MAHTPIDELESVPSFTEQLRRESAPACDSCGRPLDREVDGLRFRHAGCPAPALSDAAIAVLNRVRGPL